MKTNKQRIEEKLSKEGFIIGCWDKQLDKLNYNNIKKVLDDIPLELLIYKYLITEKNI
ncbi:MAG: hypothetical protein ACLS90_00345 [Clostridia bacterium]